MSSANEPSDEEVRQFESGIMLVLCRRYRIKAGNGEPTDYNIEEFRRIHRYHIFQNDAREVKCIK